MNTPSAAAVEPKPHFPSVLDDPQDAFWKRLLLAIYGREKAGKILTKYKRCKVCQGRLKPYTDPKVGAAANRALGVKPSLRCVRCGRT